MFHREHVQIFFDRNQMPDEMWDAYVTTCGTSKVVLIHWVDKRNKTSGRKKVSEANGATNGIFSCESMEEEIVSMIVKMINQQKKANTYEVQK